jgi:2-polyprenyl-6-methoxyphenol hydroxylase-like FAD-dependent oxidoreductase
MGQRRTALVVGAGIGGLATVVALRRAGWAVTVLDRADRPRAAGAALVLWPNAVHALRALGLGDAVEAAGTPHRLALMRRPDGRVLSRVELAPLADRLGAPVLVVHREDLHHLLLTAALATPATPAGSGPAGSGLGGAGGAGGGVEARWGCVVRGVEVGGERAVVVGDGGERWVADLVVGADGVGSVVRAAVEPAARVREVGYLAWRAVVPCGALAGTGALDGFVGGETLGVGYRFGCAPLGERGVYWYATAPGTRVTGSAQQQLDRLGRAFGGWHRPVGELVGSTDPAALLCHPVTELAPLPARFDHPVGVGGLVLVGDAAHAMTPNLGQGACLALEDAVTLGAVLAGAESGPALHAALGRYHETRYRRAARLVRRSHQAGVALELRRPAAIALRDLLASVLPGSWTSHAAASAADWRPPTIGV